MGSNMEGGSPEPTKEFKEAFNNFGKSMKKYGLKQETRDLLLEIELELKNVVRLSNAGISISNETQVDLMKLRLKIMKHIREEENK